MYGCSEYLLHLSSFLDTDHYPMIFGSLDSLVLNHTFLVQIFNEQIQGVLLQYLICQFFCIGYIGGYELLF
jgi:hypothetical protein